MQCARLSALTLVLLASAFAAAQPKSLFYLINSPRSVQSFLEHADKIDILAPAWYSADGNGLVWGSANAAVLESAARHHVSVMPIVQATNQADLHKLFITAASRATFIAAVLDQCKLHHYSGFQIDFENIFWTDRDVLSAFVAESAAALHKQNLSLTIATVPNAPGSPGPSGFGHWLYENWRGAYDLKALAQSVDLICLMTYDQNTRWTEPGPVAGYPWTVANLDYALQFVPKEKLSLGIPLYGYHWFAGEPNNDKPNPEGEYIGQPEVDAFIAAYHPRVEWDPADRASFFYFYRDDTRDWVFFTDKRVFQERLDLMRERNLQGFCSWVLGTEDPEIWSLLPSHK
jgi:spore germination protein YaaH